MLCPLSLRWYFRMSNVSAALGIASSGVGEDLHVFSTLWPYKNIFSCWEEKQSIILPLQTLLEGGIHLGVLWLWLHTCLGGGRG